MVFRRIAALACLQALLFGCGVGLTLALQARFVAVAVTLGLLALWTGVAAVWRGRRRWTPPTETPKRLASEAAHGRLLAGLLDQTPTPLVTRNAEGVLQARNRAARQLFGVDDVVRNPAAGLVEALQAGAGPVRVHAVVGAVAPRTYAVSVSDVLAAEGPLQLAVLLDIEPEVRAAEAAALRDLMQVLSHEIMNGLTPVASLAATAQDLLTEQTCDATAQAREALAVLSRRAEGLARFAESYRALARLPPPRLAPTSLGEVIDEAARLFRSQWSRVGVNLVAQAPDPDALVMLDWDQIMQALLNLLSNAAEAVLETSGPRIVRLTGEYDAQTVTLSVIDSGRGIPASNREQIFKPLFTTKSQGSGVGLSLSRQIARGHRGELELGSTGLRDETVFRLTLQR